MKLTGRSLGNMSPPRSATTHYGVHLTSPQTGRRRKVSFPAEQATYPLPPNPTVCDCGQNPSVVVQWRTRGAGEGGPVSAQRYLWLCAECAEMWREDEEPGSYIERSLVDYWAEWMERQATRGT